jgi:hypothetical protein
MVAARKELEKLHPLAGADRACYTYQRKYDLDPPCPRWKVWFFNYIYLPFVRFVYLKLKLPVCDHYDVVTGRMGWVEDQTIYLTEERAREVIADRPFWGFKWLPVEQDSPAETCQMGTHDFPGSPVSSLYLNRNFPLRAVSAEIIPLLERAVTSELLHTSDEKQLEDVLNRLKGLYRTIKGKS